MLSSFLTFALASSALALPTPVPGDTPKSAYDKSLGLILYRNNGDYNSDSASLVSGRFKLDEWEPEKILNKRQGLDVKQGDYVLIHPKRNCYGEQRNAKDSPVEKVLPPSNTAYHMDKDRYISLTCPDHDPVALLRKDGTTSFWNRKLFNKGTYHEEKADGNYEIYVMNPSCKGYIDGKEFNQKTDIGSYWDRASNGQMVKLDCSPSSAQSSSSNNNQSSSSSSNNSEKIVSTDQGEQVTGKPSDYQDKEVNFGKGGKINYIKHGCNAYRVKDNSPLSADSDPSQSGINPWEGFKVKCS